MEGGLFEERNQKISRVGQLTAGFAKGYKKSPPGRTPARAGGGSQPDAAQAQGVDDD
jgi:hypothetical protein